jgi:hypothetical protein
MESCQSGSYLPVRGVTVADGRSLSGLTENCWNIDSTLAATQPDVEDRALDGFSRSCSLALRGVRSKPSRCNAAALFFLFMPSPPEPSPLKSMSAIAAPQIGPKVTISTRKRGLTRGARGAMRGDTHPQPRTTARHGAGVGALRGEMTGSGGPSKLGVPVLDLSHVIDELVR